MRIIAPRAVDLVFMPGMCGQTALRHLWPKVGFFASIHAIELKVDDCRTMTAGVSDEEAFRCFADRFAQLVIEHLPGRRPILVGYSLGGWFAFETVQAMQRLGAPAPQLLLIEPDVIVNGSPGFRYRHAVELFLDRLINLNMPWRALKPPDEIQRNDSVNPKRRKLREGRRETMKILLRILTGYCPIPGDAPICLVVRNRRALRYATWQRLAEGIFEREDMPFKEHADFARPRSEEVLTELFRRVVDRHVPADDHSVAP